MPKHIEVLLKRLGFEEDDANKILKGEADIDAEAFFEEVNKRFWDRFKESPNYIGPIVEKERAETNGKWRSTLLGILNIEDDANLKNLPVKEFASVIFKKAEEQIRKNLESQTDSEAKKLYLQEKERADKLELELRRYNEEEIPKIRSEIENMKRNLLIQNKIQQALQKHKTVVPHESLIKMGIDSQIFNILQNKYDIVLSDTEASGIELRDKATGWKAKTKSENFLTLQDELTAYLRENHLLLEGDAAVGPAQQQQESRREIKVQSKSSGMPYAEESKRFSEAILRQLGRE